MIQNQSAIKPTYGQDHYDLMKIGPKYYFEILINVPNDYDLLGGKMALMGLILICQKFCVILL